MEHELAEQRQSLRTYLNDHLRRAAAVTDLARHAASTAHGPAAARLAALAKEFDDDRRDLLTFMAALDVRVQHIKMLAGWLSARAEVVLQRHRHGHDALASVLDIETLQAGVQRKLSSWEVLRAYLGSRRGEQRRLERLLASARRQLAELAKLHGRAATVDPSRLSILRLAGLCDAGPVVARSGGGLGLRAETVASPPEGRPSR